MTDPLSINPGDATVPAEELTPLVRRIVAPNAGPYTAGGTCTYLVGRGRIAVIDPGPDDPGYRAAILAATAGESVTHVVVTHTHRDHSPGATPLARAAGAALVGCAPHRRSRALRPGEADMTEGANDLAYRPDAVLEDGDAVAGPGWTLRAVATPGHTANHLAFSLPEENALFSGDHVMAWSTTIVAPPDGSMRDYMASLARVRDHPAGLYWPGHGGPVREPGRYVRGLLAHRRQREAAILARLDGGDATIPAIVAALYAGLAPALVPAAGLSVYAHLEDLVERGLAASDGPPSLRGRYRRTDASRRGARDASAP